MLDADNTCKAIEVPVANQKSLKNRCSKQLLLL